MANIANTNSRNPISVNEALNEFYKLKSKYENEFNKDINGKYMITEHYMDNEIGRVTGGRCIQYR
jgi:hypothetical protein